MKSDPDHVSPNGMVVVILVLLNCIILRAAFTGNDSTYWWLLLSLPVLLVAMQDADRKKRAGPATWPGRIKKIIISKLSNYANQGRTSGIDQE